MLSTPFGNLKHFLISRPPLTVFLACLATITLMGFGAAYYINVADGDSLINGDEQQNWVYFLKYLNRKEYCLEKGETPPKSDEKAPNDDNKVYIPAQISFPNGQPDFNAARGVIAIDDWPSSHSDSIAASLTFKNGNYTTQNVCVALYIPRDFLSPFTEGTCRGNDSVTVNVLTAKTSEDNGGVFCEKGTKVKLNFNEASPKNFKIVLTQSEMSSLYVRLLWFNSVIFMSLITGLSVTACRINDNDLDL